LRIAIIKLSSLGDLVHALAIFPFLNLENVEIEWFVDEKFADVIENSPYLTKIHRLPIANIKTEKSISLFIGTIKHLKSQQKYDLVVDMQGLLKSAMVLNALKCEDSIGFDRDSIREKIASTFYKRKTSIPYSEHIIKRNVKLLSEALHQKIDYEEVLQGKRFLFSTKEAEERADEILAKNQKRSILFIIEASKESKVYPLKNFETLGNMLDENIYITYHQKEQEAKELAEKIGGILLPRLNLDELKAVISRMDLVIGGDTGPTHLAWGSGVASITIFGVTPMERFCIGTRKNRCLSAKNLGVDSIADVTPEVVCENTKEILYG